MRTNLLQAFAVAMGVSICTIGQAQSPYSPYNGAQRASETGTLTQNPYAQTQVQTRWNSFNQPNVIPVAATSRYGSSVHQVSQQGETLLPPRATEEIAPGIPHINQNNGNAHAPVPQPYVNQHPDPYSTATPLPSNQFVPSAPCAPNGGTTAPMGSAGCAPTYNSPYSSALSQPWDGGCGSVPISAFGAQLSGGRPELFPWFGGANLLFLNVNNNANKVLAMSIVTGQPALYSDSVDPDNALGFEVSAGRYFKCGSYGLGVTYFGFNPDEEQTLITGGAGDFRAAMQAYHDYHLDTNNDATANQVYQYINGSGGVLETTGATNIRATRDMDFQGLELNLFSFGLMGYQRSTALCGSGGACGLNPFKGWGGNYGFGHAGGPLARPAANRLQVMTSHGFRWFQVEDDAELAYNIDGVAGYQALDIYDRVNIKNDLYGYQFGSKLMYCLSDRLGANLGGKIGVYGNDVEARRRVGTDGQIAYLFGQPANLAETHYSDTVLSTLGEVDLGLGYRVCDAWTITGGYRVMGINGIATSFNQMSQDFGTSLNPGSIHANDSLVLHGAYIGCNFNW